MKFFCLLRYTENSENCSHLLMMKSRKSNVWSPSMWTADSNVVWKNINHRTELLELPESWENHCNSGVKIWITYCSVAWFVTICTILKTWKTPMEECYFSRLNAASLRKVTLLHRCFSHFLKLYKWYKTAQCISYDKKYL